MDNRDAIVTVINKIARISKLPGYEWLLEELNSRWGGKERDVSFYSNEAINKIEKYLAIDYKIDSIGAGIDYSFIKNEMLRLQLEADWREMLRYRCGLRAHKIDIDEYCRYASLQAEGMTNYFFKKEQNLSSISEVNNLIDMYNIRINDENPSNKFRLKNIDELNDLTYNTKYCVMVIALINKGVLSGTKRADITKTLSNIYKYRNKQSHRLNEPIQLPETTPDMDNVENVLMEIATGLKNYFIK